MNAPYNNFQKMQMRLDKYLGRPHYETPFCSKTVLCANAAHNEQSHKTPFVFIKGCFAGGIYLALWFTILQQPDKTKPEDQVLAVLAVFPIVSRLTDWQRRRYIFRKCLQCLSSNKASQYGKTGTIEKVKQQQRLFNVESIG